MTTASRLHGKLGAEIILNPDSDDTIRMVESWTGGYGVDAVIFTAATSSSEALSQSFKMCKRKGRVSFWLASRAWKSNGRIFTPKNWIS
jgi:threonine dehydrogenase-like Zn-dependent dehydrogenase